MKNPTEVKDACPSSISSSDEEWTEFERKIDAQVDAIFQMAEEFNVSTGGMSKTDFDVGNQEAVFTMMDELSAKMRERQRNKKLRMPILIGVLLLAMIAGRYITPGVWVKQSFCQNRVNEPLCDYCFGPWLWNEEWIYEIDIQLVKFFFIISIVLMKIAEVIESST